MFYMFSNSAQFVHILDICSCFVSFNINRLIAVALVPSFSLIYNIPLYNCATIYLTSCWWAFIMKNQKQSTQCFYEHSCSCPLPVCLNLFQDCMLQSSAYQVLPSRFPEQHSNCPSPRDKLCTVKPLYFCQVVGVHKSQIICKADLLSPVFTDHSASPDHYAYSSIFLNFWFICFFLMI